MIKIIIITISLLLFIQFVLYYCNIDLFKFYINKKDTNIDLEETKDILKGFVNELKQYDNII
jgi:hypothetical protein